MTQAQRIVDPILTELARGYTNAAFIADALFPYPRIDMPKEAAKIPLFGKDNFRIHKTLRAPRADSNIMDQRPVATEDVILDEHDLAVPMDYRDLAEDEFNLEMDSTFLAREAMLLAREYEAAGLAQDPNNYSPSHHGKVSTVWTDPNSDPHGDVNDANEVIRRTIGRKANTMVLSERAFLALAQHPKIKDDVKYVQKAIIPPELIASLFGFERVVVGQAVFQSDLDAELMADLWHDVVLAWVPVTQTSYRQPSYGFTFRKRGWAEVDKYTTIDGKVRFVRATEMRKVKMVGADAGFLLEGTTPPPTTKKMILPEGMEEQKKKGGK